MLEILFLWKYIEKIGPLLIARILEETYSHRYRAVTLSGVIQRLIPTKELDVVEKALWSDILILDNLKKVTLGFTA